MAGRRAARACACTIRRSRELPADAVASARLATRSTRRPVPTRWSWRPNGRCYRDVDVSRARRPWRRLVVLDANRFLVGRPPRRAIRASDYVDRRGQPMHDVKSLAGRRPRSSPAPTRAWASPSPEAYVAAGAERAAVRARRGAARAARAERWPSWRDPGQIVAAVPADVSDPADVERLVADGARGFAAGTSSSTTPASTARWGRSTRSTGRRGSGRWRSTSTARSCRPGGLAAFQAAPLRQDRAALGRRRDQPAPAHHRVRRVEGGHRPLRRDRWRSKSAAFGIDVNAIAPGALNTRMLDEVLAAGPDAVGAAFYERMVRTRREEAARRSNEVRRWRSSWRSAASDGITGRLLSAVWDPWERLADAPRGPRTKRTSTRCAASSRRTAA